MEAVQKSPITPLEWLPEGVLHILDQRVLPKTKAILKCRSREDVFEAIKNLSVRGAPAIGIAGAYGVCLDLYAANIAAFDEALKRVSETIDYLKQSRPTAVNLFWALDRMWNKARSDVSQSAASLRDLLLNEAKTIHAEDKAMCEQIGLNGSLFIQDGMRVMTHCNTGALATGGLGTALGIIYQARAEGKEFHVWVNETRPLFQGARLTAFELSEAGIPSTLICDSAASFLMKQGKVDMIVTGADRIAANGDTANKIGTLSLAVNAQKYGIPFYIAAPSSTFDMSLKGGDEIIVEERHAEEVRSPMGQFLAPESISVYNPAFDVTDHELIKGFVTEKGVIKPPFIENLRRVLA